MIGKGEEEEEKREIGREKEEVGQEEEERSRGRIERRGMKTSYSCQKDFSLDVMHELT